MPKIVKKSAGGKRGFSRRGGHSSGRRRKRKRIRKNKQKQNGECANNSSKVKNVFRKIEEFSEVK